MQRVRRPVLGLDPRVIQDLVRAQTLLWVFDKKLTNQVFGWLRNVVPVRRWKVVLYVQYALEEGLIVFVVKGWKSTEHHVQYDADAPVVDFLPIAFSFYHFWGDVARSAARRRGVLSFNKARQAEIRNLDDCVLVG